MTRILGYFGDHDGPRIVDVDRHGDDVLVHIHHPVNEASGEKIRLDRAVLRTGLAEALNDGFVRLTGRMKKEKLLDIENNGPVISLWIRTADHQRDDDGWAINAPADELHAALTTAAG